MEENLSVNKKQKSYKTLIFLIIIVVILAIGVAGYVYRNNKANDQSKKDQATIARLEQEIKDLKSQINSSKNITANDNSSTKTVVAVPSANVIANIADAIKSGNTAALEGYMASSVLVILAASEGIGAQTPAQAVSDLKYLDSATDPWNFSLDSATLTKYANGDYKTYFKANTLVGKSANNYVVAFNFNEAGKINGIFMAVSADLL